MKKLIFVFLISMFLVVGCGEKKVTCKLAADGELSNYDMEVVGTLKNDKIKGVKATMTYNSKELANDYCGLLKLWFSEEQTLKYECKGNKVIIKNYDVMVKNNTNKEMINMSKNDFIGYFKEVGMTCEE